MSKWAKKRIAVASVIATPVWAVTYNGLTANDKKVVWSNDCQCYATYLNPPKMLVAMFVAGIVFLTATKVMYEVSKKGKK